MNKLTSDELVLIVELGELYKNQVNPTEWLYNDLAGFINKHFDEVLHFWNHVDKSVDCAIAVDNWYKTCRHNIVQ